MKFISALFAAATLSQVEAKISDFTPCKKGDASACDLINGGCCGMFYDKSIQGTQLPKYNCLSFTEKIIWGAEYIDIDNKNKKYNWICQEIDPSIVVK